MLPFVCWLITVLYTILCHINLIDVIVHLGLGKSNPIKEVSKIVIWFLMILLLHCSSRFNIVLILFIFLEKNKWMEIFTYLWLLFDTGPLTKWIECLPMVQGTRVQSQVKSYQRLKKWYLIAPCLTLSIIKSIWRLKWSNPGNGVVPSLTPQCSSYWKGSLRVTLN